jgi:ribonuclease HII
MVALHERFPAYEFATHKGYCTPEHQTALLANGPCPEHRFTYVNVRGALVREVDITDHDPDNVELGVMA